MSLPGEKYCGDNAMTFFNDIEIKKGAIHFLEGQQESILHSTTGRPAPFSKMDILATKNRHFTRAR